MATLALMSAVLYSVLCVLALAAGVLITAFAIVALFRELIDVIRRGQ